MVAVLGAGVGWLAYRSGATEPAAKAAGEEPGKAAPPAAAKPKEPEGGQPVNGLQLTLTADKTETVMKADSSNAEPVKLKLTFTNVSDKPIKLDIFRLSLPRWEAIKLQVNGPGAKTATEAGKWGTREPKAQDYVVIEPAKKLDYEKEIDFPGTDIGGDTRHLNRQVRSPTRFLMKVRITRCLPALGPAPSPATN